MAMLTCSFFSFCTFEGKGRGTLNLTYFILFIALRQRIRAVVGTGAEMEEVSDVSRGRGEEESSEEEQDGHEGKTRSYSKVKVETSWKRCDGYVELGRGVKRGLLKPKLGR